jgi:hypothetical protein
VLTLTLSNTGSRDYIPGSLVFYYVDENRHIIMHRVLVNSPDLPAGAVAEPRAQSKNLDLSAFNPFKSASSEDVTENKVASDNGRVQLDVQIDLGELSESAVDGLYLMSTPGKCEGLFWSSGKLFARLGLCVTYHVLI